MTDELHAPYKTLFSSPNALLVMTVEEDLRKGGFTVMLVDSGDNDFSVVVAREEFDNAVALLKQKNPKLGEIFSVPKEK
ncbi:MAG: hypothetical protein HPY85_09725 [Anaerolineae bacterium]|nr:hypothetical protein [Anaerolineae bacterium]